MPYLNVTSKVQAAYLALCLTVLIGALLKPQTDPKIRKRRGFLLRYVRDAATLAWVIPGAALRA